MTYEQGYQDALKRYGDKERDDIKKAEIEWEYGLRGFWYTNKKGEKDYKVIATRYDQGYLKALDDLMERKRTERKFMTNEQRITLQLAIDNYGIEKQCMVAMEECAELIQAISKMCRKSARNNLVEEIADVQIMIEQLKMMYCISNREINNVVDIKIERLSERIKGDKQ